MMMKLNGRYIAILALVFALGACSDDTPGDSNRDAGQDATAEDVGEDVTPDGAGEDANPEDSEQDIGEDGTDARCENGGCVEVACDDGLQNGDETDVDCGGATCDACQVGQSCGAGQDCAPGSCEQDQCIESPFLTVWNTENGVETYGGTDANSIHLPLLAQGQYDLQVDWGDATQDVITQGDQSEVTHRYAAPGEYTIKITGALEGWSFGAQDDAVNDSDKLIEIKNWGALRLGAPEHYTDGNGEGHFEGAGNLTISATDILNLEGTTSLKKMFRNCYALTNIASIGQWDVSSVTDTSGMFDSIPGFNPDVGDWDVSSVTDMSTMFSSTTQFNRDISAWDTSSVTHMSSMFRRAGLFDQDIGDWDTSALTDMLNMFRRAANFD